jgi:hypothetical protein
MTAATTTLSTQAIPGLQLAKLVIAFIQSVVDATKWIKLLDNFRTEAPRAIKAGSPLSSAITGFFNNKLRDFYRRKGGQEA